MTIYNDRTRRVAPSYDYDLAMVLQEAWQAWWLETAQHLATVSPSTYCLGSADK